MPDLATCNVREAEGQVKFAKLWTDALWSADSYILRATLTSHCVKAQASHAAAAVHAAVWHELHKCRPRLNRPNWLAIEEQKLQQVQEQLEREKAAVVQQRVEVEAALDRLVKVRRKLEEETLAVAAAADVLKERQQQRQQQRNAVQVRSPQPLCCCCCRAAVTLRPILQHSS